MKNILDLIKDCEVEWKPLGEVAQKVSSGGTPKTGVDEYYGGNIPWLRTQEVNFCDIWDTEIKITEEGLKNSSAKVIPPNCVIVAMYGATVGRVGINKIPLATNQACANIQLDDNILNYRYLFYYLSHKYEYIKSLGSGSQTNINAQIIKKLLIPIPPLEIQKKVVKTLDIFTELEATLEAELTARKKQYEYYRNKLLDFNNQFGGYSQFLSKDVVWKTLGEVGTFIRGSGLQKKDFVENGVGCIHYGQIYTHYSTFAEKTKSFVSEDFFQKAKKASYGDLVMATTSENIIDVCKTVAWLGKDDIAVSGDALIIKHNQNPKYMSYLFQIERFLKFKQKHSMGTKVIRVSTDNLKKYQIPLPPLETQQAIVDILDKFDTLTQDLTQGLPKEIELRRKQYEYYREKLLNFNNLNK
ncbi:restriction endonuclease subunit S [Rodentibacter haemolyticus]|uniref:Restriction endonuclease subunit S n=1 Tax=Rodentibacter haemolyticus TaxID=2778911 RepID=A0ABX6UX45_9PAST|nr:restriction endonuclease subunit S [Rodentibacter haemolyticus]QPB42427.1 restriction endonuclease subunit S [Rodentibacter haemolyticus]